MHKLNYNFKSFFFTLLLVLLLSVLFIFIFQLLPILFSFNNHSNNENNHFNSLNLFDENFIEEIKINNKLINYNNNKKYKKCTFYDCLNIYRCNHGGKNKLLIYIYPFKKYINNNSINIINNNLISKEYYEILKTIESSEYFTRNPHEACIFIPSIDLLNLNKINDLNDISNVLKTLNYWKNGENHFIFNMIGINKIKNNLNEIIDLDLGKAMIAGGNFNSWTYRSGFDLSIPIFSSISNLLHEEESSNLSKPWLILSTQCNIHLDYIHELKQLAQNNPELIVLDMCEHDRNSSLRCVNNRVYKYPYVLTQSVFCIVMRGAKLGQKVFHEAMAAGCIPIVISDTYILPLNEIIDWKRAIIQLPEAEINSLIEVIKNISEKHIKELQSQIKFIYNRYFKSIPKLTNTILEILNQRIFPSQSKSYEYWNIDQYKENIQFNPLFLQRTAPRWQGFTAVILTYDRLHLLFILMEKLSQVPSVAKILVIWNNQKKYPPHYSKWPKISKNWTIIKTNENKLSKRFYPYSEIETEAVLSIDDDITMLTTDELEFGFEVWCEFPDRIVGFPSRTHVYDNITNSYKYESEWKNEISMVLTGAAFYHKYWNYMYTTQMPSYIRQYVDDHMNCEDIALNFLVSNITNKSPIKVTPKKKFKCPHCRNSELSSSDRGHMTERSKCINLFTSIYSKLTLKNVQFRADPVLFKDNFPKKLKRFNDIGSL